MVISQKRTRSERGHRIINQNSYQLHSQLHTPSGEQISAPSPLIAYWSIQRIPQVGRLTRPLGEGCDIICPLSRGSSEGNGFWPLKGHPVHYKRNLICEKTPKQEICLIQDTQSQALRNHLVPIRIYFAYVLTLFTTNFHGNGMVNIQKEVNMLT